MATDEDAEPGLDIDLIAASLRAEASDLGAVVEALAPWLTNTGSRYTDYSCNAVRKAYRPAPLASA